MSLVNVANFAGALQGVAATSLRSVIGDIPLDDVLSQREKINETLRLKLDEVTERWGGKVTTVEIREILPPPAVQEAMNRQLSAERTRRAVITESEGTRQATINVAEGDKQSAILRAEGDRQAAILRAQGFSNALKTIFEAAKGIDQKTMALQYLDALKALGSGPATKFVIPLEFTQLIGPIGSMVKSGMARAPTTSPRSSKRAKPAVARPPSASPDRASSAIRAGGWTRAVAMPLVGAAYNLAIRPGW
jgi:regulator of protease activity HflC (stomatin/prohibitin superfamily)